MSKREGLGRARMIVAIATFLGACGPSQPLVDVDVVGVTDDVDRLDLQPTLQGSAALTQVTPITQNYSHFRLRLDSGARGELLVNVTAKDGDGCDVSVGAQPIEIDGPGNYNVTVTLMPQPGCMLIVHKTGDGVGQVSLSDGTVWSFGSAGPPDAETCHVHGIVSDFRQTKLPRGTQVQLVGEVSLEQRREAYFAGWSGGCQGVAPCRIQIDEHQRTVEAGFLPTVVCSSARVCWENPRPQGTSLFRIFGRASNDVWAVGDSGAVLRWNGSYWSSPRRVNTTDGIYGLWIEDAHNLVLVTGTGKVQRYDDDFWGCPTPESETRLRDVWGASANDLWAVGEQGALLHWDGAKWQSVNSPAGSAALYTVRGTSQRDVWAVGERGTVLHYDGMSWSQLSYPGTNPPALYDIWLSAPGEAWIVGGATTIAAVSGGVITVQTSMGGRALFGIWGTTVTDIWTVGEDGLLLHYDGDRWSSVESTTILHLRSVWGTGVSDVWAVGDNGTIIHYNGTVWLPVSLTRGNSTINALWGPSAGVGPNGNSVIAIGERGLGLQWSGADWVTAPSIYNVTPRHLNAIWGPDADNLWIVCEAGEILRSGGTMAPMMRVPSNTMENLYGIWGSSTTNILAVGDRARLLRYDGMNWTESIVPAAAGQPLRGIWGSAANAVWIVGDFGTLLRYDGTTATAATTLPLTVRALHAVWGSTASDVWVVGDGGTILHYDGTQWSAHAKSGQLGANNLRAIFGLSARDVWAVGDEGAMLHYDGADWMRVDSGSVSDLRALWGDLREGLIVGGQGSAILRFRTN